MTAATTPSRTARSGAARRPHWTGLDGIRGVGALAVVIFHAALGIAVNGYAGVDVFFALSGFLITTLLLGEHARNGRVSLARFYARRVLRLYPALVATCALVLGLALVGGAVTTVLPAIGSALLYVSNWWVYSGGHAPMLEHTWTLAIEEHFYFAWPLLLMGFLSRRWWARALAGGAVLVLVSLLLIPWPASIEGVRGSYLRGTPIVWGTLLAVLLRRAPRLFDSRRGTAVVSTAGGLSLAALLVILTVPVTLPGRIMGGVTGLPGLLTLPVILAAVRAPTATTSRALAWTPLVWAGRRSYGIYLYHFPLLSLLLHHVSLGPGAVRAIAGMVLTLLVAEISYRYLEMPFLRLKHRFEA